MQPDPVPSRRGSLFPPNPATDKCLCGVGVGGRIGAVYIWGRWLHSACWIAHRWER